MNRGKLLKLIKKKIIKKTKPNIILNGKKKKNLGSFHAKIKNNSRMSLLITVFQHGSEVLDDIVRHRKEIKGI